MKLKSLLDTAMPWDGHPSGRRWKLNAPDKGLALEASLTRLSSNRLMVVMHVAGPGIPNKWFDVGVTLHAEDEGNLQLFGLNNEEVYVTGVSDPGEVERNILMPHKKNVRS